MPTKAELMTGSTEQFIASMNPKKEAKRQSSSTIRRAKRRHKKSGS
jgi:hypothetical protein